MQTQEIFKTINSISKKINDLARRTGAHTEMRDNKNEADISDTQNAACELSEEMDIGMSDLENAICEQSEMIEQALSDIENALCELTEE